MQKFRNVLVTDLWRERGFSTILVCLLVWNRFRTHFLLFGVDILFRQIFFCFFFFTNVSQVAWPADLFGHCSCPTRIDKFVSISRVSWNTWIFSQMRWESVTIRQNTLINKQITHVPISIAEKSKTLYFPRTAVSWRLAGISRRLLKVVCYAWRQGRSYNPIAAAKYALLVVRTHTMIASWLSK